jgi:hypothetical protein
VVCFVWYCVHCSRWCYYFHFLGCNNTCTSY